MTNNNNNDPIIVQATAVQVLEDDENNGGASSSSQPHRAGGDVHQLALDLEELQQHVIGLQAKHKHLKTKIRSYEEAAFTVFTVILGLVIGSAVQFWYQATSASLFLNAVESSGGNTLAAAIGSLLREAYAASPYQQYSRTIAETVQQKKRRLTKHAVNFTTGADSRYTGPMQYFSASETEHGNHNKQRKKKTTGGEWRPHGGYGVEEFPNARQEGVWFHGKLNGYARVLVWEEVFQNSSNTATPLHDNDNNHETTTIIQTTLYQGQFHNHQLHGHGTITWPDGSHFDGQFRHYQRHGHGTLFNATTGERNEGVWHKNQLVMTTTTTTQQQEQNEEMIMENGESVPPHEDKGDTEGNDKLPQGDDGDDKLIPKGSSSLETQEQEQPKKWRMRRRTASQRKMMTNSHRNWDPYTSGYETIDGHGILGLLTRSIRNKMQT